ncbi:MAG: hypothetical protein HQK89_06710 [Nitrospirae bacterium]|nr:hypothetical protein [Nitrospirota bacterium]
MIDCTHALKFIVDLKLRTNLLLRTGEAGEFTDSTIEKTPDGSHLHINGYVWSSLLMRAMGRLREYEDISGMIGKYDRPEEQGVSLFWFEPSIVPLSGTDTRPGIKVDRQYGSTTTGALFNDEIVPPGLKMQMRFTCFCKLREIKRVEDKIECVEDNIEHIKKAISSTLWVVNDGIENIGGGWVYGHGRLDVFCARMKTLDLTKPDDRKLLWAAGDEGFSVFDLVKPKDADIRKPWNKLTVKAAVARGQLLGIHSSYPLSLASEYEGMSNLPDTFMFRRYWFDDDGELKTQYAITGKSIRQALLSVPIERKLRTQGNDICETPAEYCTCPKCKVYRESGQKGNSPKCTCLRCAWFGSTKNGGIIAVTDGVFNDKTKTGKPECVIINRIQLCEHSMQNIQLFSGEYLKQGTFKFEIFIDMAMGNDMATSIKSGNDLLKEVECILNEAKGDNGPPGWHRIGATSTCTGQIEIRGVATDNYGDSMVQSEV